MPRQVLVTGGAQRLGALLCRQFAQAGWAVWCHYQRSGAAAEHLAMSLREQGATAHTVQADLAVEAERAAMVAQIVAQAGALHCLVNNASSFEDDRADAFSVEAARQQLEVNLLAPLALAQHMAQHLPPTPRPALLQRAACAGPKSV